MPKDVTIKINLADPNSIKKAIARVDRMRKSTSELERKMVERITLNLADRIRYNCLSTVGVSALAESIHGEVVQTSGGHWVGQIWGADYLVYVEYGTGPVGAAAPNPDRPAGWVYGSTPWVYFEERLNGFVTTYGQAPRPFIRKSIEEERARIKGNVRLEFYDWTAST